MSHDVHETRHGERGSALVIATLVMVIMTLLGISFLMMAETENRIAENEKLSAQALFFGEAGARTVKRWFDRPRSVSGTIFNWNLDFPTVSQIRRDLRRIDTDGPGPIAPVLTDGNAAGAAPYYKQGMDLNGDGLDDFFDRPYRSDALNTFLGTPDGPDIRISRADSTAAKAFLDGLSEKLMAGFPASGAGIRARIQTIDVYGPPFLQIGGSWTRYGLATVAVTAQIVKFVGTAETILASRTIRAVVNETPYPGPFGPLHSCDELTFTGEFNVHWGTATGAGPSASSMPNNPDKLALSIPREIPPNPKVDWFNGQSNAATFATLKATLEAGAAIQDPWFRLITGGPITNAGTTGWGVGDPQLFVPDATGNQDHSNIFQNLSPVGCPDFDYDTWRTIAQSGGSDVHYYTWVTGDQFSENGSGPATPFVDITALKTGLYFFDTIDQSRPLDTNGDGIFENLTPEIDVQGGQWGGMKGMLYLNTDTFMVNGTNSQGMNAKFTLPGEPYRDSNSNGKYDPGEPWVNLNYNSLTGLTSTIRGAALDRYPDTNASATLPSYNREGPQLIDKALFWGVMYNSGQYDSQGTPRYLGSVLTGSRQTKSGGTVDIYWDPTILTRWPPPDWDLPRVVITRWETDLN